jgi:hypothetical protein
MHPRRTSVVLATAIGVALVGVWGVAGAAPVSTNQTQGAGNFSCGTLSGHIAFKPPLKPNGTKPETVTIKVTATDCSGGTPTPTRVKGAISIAFGFNNCQNQQMGNITGHLGFLPKVEASQWRGFAYLAPDFQGDPVVMNAEPSEISPSYYSDAFGGSGAFWEFDPDFRSSNLCTTKSVASASFSDGAFSEF